MNVDKYLNPTKEDLLEMVQKQSKEISELKSHNIKQASDNEQTKAVFQKYLATHKSLNHFIDVLESEIQNDKDEIKNLKKRMRLKRSELVFKNDVLAILENIKKHPSIEGH